MIEKTECQLIWFKKIRLYPIDVRYKENRCPCQDNSQRIKNIAEIFFEQIKPEDKKSMDLSLYIQDDKKDKAF
ncbi:hypothetical protein CRS_25420 [Chryseobacterium sp. ON_d1]|nr:hypothetical protein CRS_25420 [Chryseobacterium sp. ON_d1]